jgi:hypothetical protein
MEQPTWWYLLAGLILGFSISTLWEWLYYRRKRLVLTDRRIAELEAGLRAASRAQQELTLDSAEAWPAASYRSPDVFLETEASQPAGGWSVVAPQSAAQPVPEPLPAPVRAGNGPVQVNLPPAPAAERVPTATMPANGHNGQHPRPSAGVSVAASNERPPFAGASTGASTATSIGVIPPHAPDTTSAPVVVERQAPPVSATEIKQLAASIHALLDEMGRVASK